MRSDMTELATTTSILDQGQFPFYSVSEHGIEFKQETPQNEWLSVMEQVTKMFESSHRLHVRVRFILGDALTFGEAAYGEKYAQGIDMTRKVMQLSEKSIKNAAWICSSIAPSLRRETLTFAHHEVVAALDPKEQAEFLDQAESESLTVSALKRVIKARHPLTKRRKVRVVARVGLRVDNAEQAQDAATQLSGWLVDNEKELSAAQLREFRPLLAPLFKFYRRHWQGGHKRV